jgi:hypothetical protein
LQAYFKRLVARTEKTGQNRFAMATVCMVRFDPGLAKRIEQDEITFLSAKRFNECGTTACIGGHMAMVPEFRRKGLRLFLNAVHTRAVSYIDGDVVEVDANQNPVNDDMSEIGSKYLGISVYEASMLFFSDLDQTDPRYGLDQITKLVEKYREGRGDQQIARRKQRKT